MLRRSCFITAIGLIQMLLFGCRPLVITSSRAEQAIVIDGYEKDWQSVPLHRLESWDAAIGLCNDSEFLFLLLLFKDPMLIMQADFRGIVLEFSDPDHGETMLTLHYAGADSLHPVLEPEDSFWQCLNEDQKKRMMRRRVRLKNRITITLAGQSFFIPPDGSQGPSAARIFDLGFTGYEWRIPINNQSGSSFSLDLNAGAAVDIRIRPGEERASDSASGRGPHGGIFLPGPSMDRGGRPVHGRMEIRFRLVLSR